ncbi:MAG: bifunctional diguanylate cyclase/phosphodiesterase [Ruminococcus sp.]|nr:bifunctional diguanylate cyclase/phosphodiesterase [Ruminococcus sp.]
MDKNLLPEYHKHFEALIDNMTKENGFKLDDIIVPLAELCKIFRMCRGVTSFYKTPEDEKMGVGEHFVCYDNGIKGKVAYSRRKVIKTMTIIETVIYSPDDEPPLDEEEYEMLDVIVRALQSFVTRNRLETQTEKLTYYDEAGYMNTRAFMRFINQRIEDNTIYEYAAMRINLHHFSIVNREIGRRYGDIVMRKYFDIITDAIGDHGIMCRMGGDNFVGAVGKEQLDSVIHLLKGTPVIYDLNRTKRVMIVADAGVFVIDESFRFSGSDDVMDKLNAALQEAKSGFKDNIVFFDDRMIVDKEKKMFIQQYFPKAMKDKDIKVFYQPKVDVKTGEIVGAEALCRWFREGVIIPPMDFIPVLEQGTDICVLDFYMLNEVCGDLRRWLDSGRKVVRISVNLSRKHMMDIDLLERIMGIIRRNDVPPEYIEIELTETTTDVEFLDLKRVVNALQQTGVYTSVDDFGMGYSSLNLIREIPWNVLKVDRSFLPVDGDDSKSIRSVMFKYVVAMAKELGLECIAEGVETKQQVDILRSNKCEIAQGFFFDRPLPVADFEKRLDAKGYNIEDGSLIV